MLPCLQYLDPVPVGVFPVALLVRFPRVPLGRLLGRWGLAGPFWYVPGLEC